jgi:predicted ribosome quality control (RQC) complex YloA/Tae2 family protein
LAGRSIDRVWRPGHHALLLRFSGRDKRRLLIDLDDDRPRWILTDEWPETPDRPDGPTLHLRGALENWRVVEVSLAEDRALRFELSRSDQVRELRLQLAGRYLNVAVTGEGLEEAVPLLRDRPATDGSSPPLRPGGPLLTADEGDEWLRAIDRMWRDEYAEVLLTREQTGLRRALRGAQKRLERSLAKIGRDLGRAQDADGDRRRGDLIKTILGRVEVGASHVDAVDYAAEGCPTVRVPLDPSKDAVTNMERYYRSYRRFSQARAAIEARHKQEQERQGAVEACLAELDALDVSLGTEARERLSGCAETARGLGIRPRERQSGRRRAKEPATPYHEFRSANGARILVGRSAKDNDALTFRVARGRDRWLHARDAPGSHVVIPVDRGAEPDHETMLDAAHLALHHSRARGEAAADVQWTERKHIRRVPGAAPGRVTVAAGRTLRIVFDDGRLQRLYEQRDPTLG